MSERRSTRGPVPRWRRVVARLAALSCLLLAGLSLYLVADGVGLSSDDFGGGGGDEDAATAHPIATFGSGKDLDLAVGEGGRVGVIFRRPTPTGTQTLARLGTSKGGFGPLKRLSRTSSSMPRIALNADGFAVALWVSVDPANLKRLQTSIAAPGRQFGPARTLDRTLGQIKLSGLGITAEGDVTATWRRDGRARITERDNGQFAPAREASGEPATPEPAPSPDRRELELLTQIDQRPEVGGRIELVTSGEHTVLAYRETAARKGHIEIVSIY